MNMKAPIVSFCAYLNNTACKSVPCLFSRAVRPELGVKGSLGPCQLNISMV